MYYCRDKQATNAGSGPEFFGFSHPTIMSLIQDMEGADKCNKYKRTDFLMATSRGGGQGGGGGGKIPSKGSTTTNSNSKRKKPSAKGLGSTKAFYKTTKRETSTPSDPSLAPVVINRQLSSLQRDSSSDGSSSDDSSEPDLVIDTM